MIHTFCEHVVEVSDAAQLRSFLGRPSAIDQWRAGSSTRNEFAQITHRPVMVYVNLMRRMKRWDALGLDRRRLPARPVRRHARRRPRASSRRCAARPSHLYVLDSMGLPPAIGLGLALASTTRASRRSSSIEGDGSLLMGLSTLATIGLTRPAKLRLDLLDNGAYSATGNQPTAARWSTSARWPRACGMQAREVDDLDGLRGRSSGREATPGPL